MQRYNGLTLLMEKPSRLDTTHLLSGDVRDFVSRSIAPFSLEETHLVEARGYVPLPDTKLILHLGNTGHLPEGVTLFQQRGAPWVSGGIINMCSIFPQDAIDRKNFYLDPDEDDEEKDEKKSDSIADKTTAGVTRRRNWRWWLRKDLQKAARLTKDGLVVNKCEYHIMPRLDVLYSELLTNKGQTLYLDIETRRDLRLTCFGFGWHSSKTFSVPMMMPDDTYFYGELETAKILRALHIAMRDNLVVIHNASFDLFVLFWRYGLPIPRNVYDTLLAHHRCFTEIEKSLGHCLSLYTDQPYHKNEGIFEPHSSRQVEQLLNYNCKDVEALTLIKPEIEDVARQLGAGPSIAQANASLRPYITETCEGLHYDEEKRKSIVETNIRKVLQLERCLRIMVGHELNPNSWQQVGNYLYKEKQYEVPSYSEDGSTDEKTLRQIALKVSNPVINFILKVRAIKKETGALKFTPLPARTYGKAPAPRLTCAWVISGTDTFRLASRKMLKLWGTNMQNWTKRLRKIIKPPPGMKFLQVDQSGAEALIVAYLCRRGKYRELFENKVKVHIYVALGLFKQQFEAELGYKLDEFIEAPIAEMVKLPRWNQVSEVIAISDEWPGKRRYYFMAKKTCHSANYDIKWPTFRLSILQETEGQLCLSPDESKGFLLGYRGMFTEIPEWHLETQSIVKSDRRLCNLFGFPRQFTGQFDEQMFKKAYAFVPQSTVGTITNITFTSVFNELEQHPEIYGRECSVVQNNHDSVLVQGPEELMPQLTSLVQRYMNCELMNPRGEIFHMKSAATVSDSWGG